jgi:hypothetical protein
MVNPICHLLALLGAHHILHVSRVRVKSDADTRSCMDTSRSYFKQPANVKYKHSPTFSVDTVNILQFSKTTQAFVLISHVSSAGIIKTEVG